jgi:hypothetical protein
MIALYTEMMSCMAERQRDFATCRSSRLLVLALASVFTLGGLAGCQKPLFPKSKEMTQFDSYDRRRYRLPPRTVMDPFGQEQPNLRERLRPDR